MRQLKIEFQKWLCGLLGHKEGKPFWGDGGWNIKIRCLRCGKERREIHDWNGKLWIGEE
jgi:hypothetical protein